VEINLTVLTLVVHGVVGTCIGVRVGRRRVYTGQAWMDSIVPVFPIAMWSTQAA